MKDSICTDKEDRYLTEKKQVEPSLSRSTPLFSNKKRIMLILVLLILVLLLSLTFIKSSNQEITATDNPQQASNSQNSIQNDQYDVLTPPAISRDATQSEDNAFTEKERIEIPGEVTDLLSQKIDQINAQESEQHNVTLNSQSKVTNNTFNELPLGKVIGNNHYTIQINASSSLDSLLSFVKLHKLTNYQLIEKKRDNKPWFILIKGDYPTHDDAKQALKSLSADLQNSSPWIKSGTSINQ